MIGLLQSIGIGFIITALGGSISEVIVTVAGASHPVPLSSTVKV